MATLGCFNHTDTTALWVCGSCHFNWCDECSVKAKHNGGITHLCLKCGHMLGKIAGAEDRIQKERAPIFGGGKFLLARTRELLRFPVQKNTLLLVAGLAILTAPLRWAVAGGGLIFESIGVFFVYGFTAAFYFHCVRVTATGKTELEQPDFTGIYDDIAAPLIRYAGALIFSILSIASLGGELGSFLLALTVVESTPRAVLGYPLPALFMAIGLILLPLLTIIAALANSLADVLNPVNWLRNLRLLGSTYWVGAAMFYAVLAVEVAIWNPLLWKLRAAFDIPVLTVFVTTALSYLPMMLRARILGAVCEPYMPE